MIKDMKRRALFLLSLLFFVLPSVAAAQIPAPTCELIPAATSVQLGKTVNLKWTSTNATQGNITTIGLVGTNGVQGVIPTSPATTYTGTFVGPGGTGVCKVTISIIQGTAGAGAGDASGGVEVPGQINSPGTINAPGTVNAGGTVNAPGTVAAPDKLGPAPTAGSIPVLPTAQNNIRLSNNEGSGIVPCGGANDPRGATGCEACSVVQLAQNIINFLIGLSIPLAAAMFAWAGAIYFMSGVVNKLEKARKIFSSTLIGFSLVVGGYLMIETILHTILDKNYFTSWNQVSCVKPGDRPISANISDLINTIPLLRTDPAKPVVVSSFNDRFTGATSGFTYSCPSGWDLSGTECYNSVSGDVTSAVSSPYSSANSATGNSGVGTAQWTQQLADACASSGLDSNNCLLAQAIMANESSGRPGVVSSAGAVGLMQVLPTTACSMDPSIPGCGSCTTRADNTNGNCATAAQALLNPALNMQMGTREISNLAQRFNYDPALIAAGYNGGAGANKASATCQGSTIWQCTANAGYAETRNYVPKVLNTLSKLQ